MGGWCQTAVNHLTKEETGNSLCLSSYSSISGGDKDRVLSLDESGFYLCAHGRAAAALHFETLCENQYRKCIAILLFKILYCCKPESESAGVKLCESQLSNSNEQHPISEPRAELSASTSCGAAHQSTQGWKTPLTARSSQRNEAL